MTSAWGGSWGLSFGGSWGFQSTQPEIRRPGGAPSSYDPLAEQERLDRLREETQAEIKKAIDAVKRPKKAKAKAPVEAAAPVATYFKDATPAPIVLAAPLTNPDAIAVNVSDILFRADDEIAIALLL